MARQVTIGGEYGSPAMEPGLTNITALTASTANPRLGIGFSLRDTVSTDASGTPWSVSITTAVGTTIYIRAYIAALVPPTTTVNVFGFTGNAFPHINFFTDGSLALVTNSPSNTFYTSAAGFVTSGTYHCYEIGLRIGVGATDYVEFRIDGQSVFSTTTASLSDAVPGFIQGVGTGSPTDFDDMAVNDDTGANQNSWCGAGKVILLKPTADSARGANWTGGAGGTTNLFAAVDNTPPVGVVLASATNTSQIKNVAKDLVTVYDATLQTYTVGGIIASDIISLVQPIAVIGGSNTTMNLGITGVSNPAAAEVTGNVTGTIAGTFPTGWTLLRGTLVYAPSVTLGTAPVSRFRKNTSSTNAGMSALMGLLVEYYSTPSLLPPPFRYTSSLYQR